MLDKKPHCSCNSVKQHLKKEEGSRRRLKLKVKVCRMMLPLLLGVLVLALTGCYGGEVKQEIWLKGNERWDAELTLTFNADERELLGEEFEEEWDLLIEEAKGAEDVSIELDRREELDGGISYLVKMSGEGWDTLNEVCFEGAATIREGDKGHTHLSWNTGSSDYIYVLREFQLIIHGKEIVSSNANTVSDDETAVWHNPSQVRVELKEKSFPVIPVLIGLILGLFVLVLLVGGGLGLFVLLRRQRSKSNPT